MYNRDLMKRAISLELYCPVGDTSRWKTTAPLETPQDGRLLDLEVCAQDRLCTVYSDRGCTFVIGTQVKGDTMNPLVCVHIHRERATHWRKYALN